MQLLVSVKTIVEKIRKTIQDMLIRQSWVEADPLICSLSSASCEKLFESESDGFRIRVCRMRRFGEPFVASAMLPHPR